jgi:class 3 adenylate cyclase
MLSIAEELIDRITAAIHYLRTGKPVAPIAIPEDLPDNEIRQLMTFVNRFLVEFSGFSEALAQMAQGELNTQPVASRMSVVQSLKTLHSNLKHLTWKTQQVAAGDLEQKVDFMGDFSTAFNSMTQQLKDSRQQLLELNQQLESRNRFIRETFGRYTSDDIVEVLLDMPEGLKLGGEKREVTILMTDLRGFTALAERLEPTAVVALLNHYLSAMIEIIQHHGGTIDEIIGDAILVLFGAPVPMPDAARRAVLCALEMQQAMQGVNEHNTLQGWPEIGMGIGLHTGEAVVGNLGSTKRSKYGVVGRTVNLTARVESYTIGGQVLASPSLLEAAGPGLILGEEIKVSAKGMKEPLNCRELLGHTDYPELNLAVRKQEFTLLTPPVACYFVRLVGKHLESQRHPALLQGLAPGQALLHTASPLARHSNIILRLEEATGPEPPELYAKVTRVLAEPDQGCILHFTSVSPAMQTHLDRLLGKQV